jgi:hypothetical protein
MNITRTAWTLASAKKIGTGKSEPGIYVFSEKKRKHEVNQLLHDSELLKPATDACIQIPELRSIISKSGEAVTDTRITTPQNETSVSSIDEEGIFSGLAGLVLLHPFLYAFLRHMKLADDGKFVDLYAQQKTILLFHYLATGKWDPGEHELIIPKILCGYPLETTLDTSIPLEPAYLEGADELLADVVQQWEIMKGTSADGLRESFLQRSGKLTFLNDAFLLQIEKNSIDMLLDRLPWSIQYVKLPWMRKMLKVQWR